LAGIFFVLAIFVFCVHEPEAEAKEGMICQMSRPDPFS